MKTYVLLEFTHSKPILDLAEKAAGRAYTLSGVEDCRVCGPEDASINLKRVDVADEEIQYARPA